MTDQFTPEQVEAVAKGLSEKKRRFLLSLPTDGEKIWPKGMTSEELSGLRGFGQSGLIRSWYGDGVRHGLTPLGLAVRQYLQAPGTQPDSGAGPSSV